MRSMLLSALLLAVPATTAAAPASPQTVTATNFNRTVTYSAGLPCGEMEGVVQVPKFNPALGFLTHIEVEAFVEYDFRIVAVPTGVDWFAEWSAVASPTYNFARLMVRLPNQWNLDDTGGWHPFVQTYGISGSCYAPGTYSTPWFFESMSNGSTVHSAFNLGFYFTGPGTVAIGFHGDKLNYLATDNLGCHVNAFFDGCPWRARVEVTYHYRTLLANPVSPQPR